LPQTTVTISTSPVLTATTDGMGIFRSRAFPMGRIRSLPRSRDQVPCFIPRRRPSW
jgi:hypothetical protein